ncbi:transmembrane protein, putative (macronuclear) [Tetrahymena thermophila SB210]|uniref:Transmembrane protein, putative n=1 Tax=Tetrahymena thermophila (strain SB210) TaxID=312017 RepID=Q22PA3_TETTS|nr:transmembrane protein, putative [Tetrahymena thermophila SB210]EAR87206.2 transmembrane protein, putative [Tetrahymena thermophila SB210]|eukprot:XP_001007451.2 transmembrane protein, putative [Tetrahymena thermophila SB210]
MCNLIDSNLINDIDFYLEQFWLASQQAQKDDLSSFNLLQMVSQHKEHCVREICNCKQEEIYDDRNQLRIELVKNIIDTVFSDCIQNKVVIKNRATREHLFLKYITFVAKFQRNPLRAYYELKKYYKTYPKDNSSYFIGVCQVLSRTFKQMITAHQELLYSMQKQEQKSTFNSKVTLTMKDIIKTQEIQNSLVPLLADYTLSKLQHFKQLKSTISSMDGLRIISKELYVKYQKLRHQFSHYSKYFSKMSIIEPNFILQKILQIFQIVIFNEVKKPLLLERQMTHLIQKGSSRPFDELNSYNLNQGNIITIFTSVNQNYKILNRSNSSLANFFGFNQIEFSSFKRIEDLMPTYISNIHQQLINGFIHKGHSQILSSNQKVFSINKQGFIFPVQLQVSVNYSYQDDFRMSATLLKLISQQGYIIFNQSGQIKGIDKNFFSSFFDLKIVGIDEEQQGNGVNENEYQSAILKEIQKLNIFTFMPCLIKSIKEFLNQLSTQNRIEYESQNIQNKNSDDKNTNLKSISRRLLFSKNDIKIEIPLNLIELNQSLESQFQTYQSQAKINQNQTQKSSKQSSKNYSLQNKLEALSFFKQFYKTQIQEWNRANCLKSANCQANLIVHIINSSNQRHQHIVEDQEFIFEIEINDLKQRKQTLLNTIDLHDRMQNEHTLQAIETENTISDTANKTQISSHNLDSQDQKKLFSSQFKNQNSKDLNLKRNSQIFMQKTNNYNQSSSKQNYSTEKINNQFIKSSSISLVQQPQITKTESNKTINNANNKIQIEGDSNKLQTKERILEEEHYTFNLMSQITSNRNLLSQQEFEFVCLSPHKIKSEENVHTLNNDLYKQDSAKINSKTLISQDKSINQINYQTTQIITSLNNINSPLSAQFHYKNQLQLEKSCDQKSTSNHDSFQLIEMFKNKMKQNYITKNQKLAQILQNNNYKNEASQQKVNQDINKQLSKNTPSRPTNNTDKQEKEEIKLDKNIQMENIHEGSSTTSNSSSRQELIVYQIIHKRSIRSNSKIIILLIFDILAFISISLAYYIKMQGLLSQVKDSLNISQQQSLLGQYYDQQALTQLIKYEYNLNILPNELENAVSSFNQSYCNQIGSNFQMDLQKNINRIIELSQSQDQIQTFDFSSNQKIEVKLNQLEFYLLAMQKIRAVCESEHIQNQINSIYFMYENQIIIQQNSRELIQNNIDQQNQNIENLQKHVILIIIITVAIFLFASILSLPLMKSINKFQEIIYFVLSRTTVDEADKEITKLELFHRNLQNNDCSWIEYNFCSDFIIQKMALKINSQESSTAHSAQVALKQLKQKKAENKIQQQHISSKMSDQKLSVFKYFIMLCFFGFTAICFLAVSVIFYYEEQSFLKQQLDVFNTTMKTKLSFHSIITLSEFTYRKSIIQQHDLNFPFDQYQKAINIFNQDMKLLNTYSNYMSNAIQNRQIFDSQNMSYLEKLFNQNLCEILSDQEVCKNTSTIKQEAINGFFSIISSYLYYFQQFSSLYNGSLNQSETIQMSWEYSSLDQYKYLIAYGFQLPIETFNLIQNQLYSLLDNQIKQIQQFYTFYMLIGEITLIVIWLVFSVYLKQKINLDVQSAQFALTCLPFQKAQEETTIYLLKSIFKY